MVSIVEAIHSGLISDSEVAAVIIDKSSAEGLIKVKARGIKTLVITRKGRTREEHDAEIIIELKNRAVELVCLWV